jgi:hypothetical protein
MFSWVVSRNPRGGVDIGEVIVFAMAQGGPVLVVFVARCAWSGQGGQHGGRWKGH